VELQQYAPAHAGPVELPHLPALVGDGLHEVPDWQMSADHMIWQMPPEAITHVCFVASQTTFTVFPRREVSAAHCAVVVHALPSAVPMSQWPALQCGAVEAQSASTAQGDPLSPAEHAPLTQ
jgi:hypothetical protein